MRSEVSKMKKAFLEEKERGKKKVERWVKETKLEKEHRRKKDNDIRSAERIKEI